MAAAGLQISENSFLVKYFDMVNAKLHLVWGHFEHGNPAMPFIFYPTMYIFIEIKKQLYCSSMSDSIVMSCDHQYLSVIIIIGNLIKEFTI